MKSEQVDSGGNIFTEKEFDSKGRVSRVTNPFRANETKIWTTNVYDEASRIKEVILPDGAKVKTDYGVSITAPIGVTKQITDPANKKRKGITNVLGQMVRVIEDPTGTPLNTDYVFDTLGNLRKTIQGEQSRYFSHDSLGRLRRAGQPERDINAALALPHPDPITGHNQWSVAYSYDDNGNIISTTDAKNQTVSATFDNLNRLKVRDYSDSTMPDVSFYYDGLGLGSVPNFSKGKTTKVASSVSETHYKSFDSLGRLLTHEQRTTPGQLAGTETPYQTAYTRNLSGALIEETYPSGRVVKNTLDQNGALSQVQSKKNVNFGFHTYVGSFTYNSAGAVTKMQLGNGHWETAQYNNRLQITQIGLGTTDTTQNLLKLELDYGTNTQNNSSLRKQTITVPTTGQTAGFTAVQTYAYDDMNRLQSAIETVSGNQTWKQTFTIDRYGNRRFDAANTTTLGSCTEAVCNPTISTNNNRISSSGYEFDANGNVTQDAAGKDFIYDAEDHQNEVKDNLGNTIGQYFYDGNGKRVKKISSTETTIFVYNAGGTLVAEYSTQISQTPQVSYLTTDHLGSPRVITNENGQVISRKDYTAFGEENFTIQRATELGYSGADDIRKGYTGYEKDDESGLDFAQARYYNKTHGRFTSVDPLTVSASIKNPQTFNRYSYVLNSPYKFTDPLGLLPEKATGSCNFECRVTNAIGGKGTLSETDRALALFHIRNGSALGYRFLNAAHAEIRRQSSPPPATNAPPKSVYGRVTQFERKTDILTRVSCAGWTRETCSSVPGSEEQIVVSDEVNATVVASDEETGGYAREDPRTGLFRPDHRGHLIARALGGAGDESNLFSQAPGVNQSEFVKWENTIRSVLTEHPDWRADIKITLKYPLPMRHPWIQGIYSIESYEIMSLTGTNFMRARTVTYGVTFRDSSGNVTERMSGLFSN